MADTDAKFAPNDYIVVKGLGEDVDYDIDDPLDGHIGIVVKPSVCAGNWVVRLLHRDPWHFVHGKPFSSVSSVASSKTKPESPPEEEEEGPQEGENGEENAELHEKELLKEVLEDLKLLEDGDMPDDLVEQLAATLALPQMPSLQRFNSLSSAAGDEDVLDGHDLVMPEENLGKLKNFSAAVSLGAFAGYVEIDNNTCGAGMLAGAFNAVHQLAAPEATLYGHVPRRFEHWRDEAAAPASKAAAPMSLQASLQQLHAVAAAHLADTEKALAKRSGDQVLEQRVKRLRKAMKSLLSKVDPNTWQIGNLEIDMAMKSLGFTGGVLLSREIRPAGVKDGDGAMKNWLWSKLKELLSSERTAVMFHLHGVLNGSCYFGHYALIFAAAEFRAEDAPKKAPLVRKVLTARSYQGPRHWLDLDQVHRFIFKAKFPGYQIWAYSRR